MRFITAIADGRPVSIYGDGEQRRDFTYVANVVEANLSAAVARNVVSQETDVREVFSKVALGEADAGFVYSTDARTVPGQVTALTLARLRGLDVDRPPGLAKITLTR